jgi:CheY-like chemotaxis protein
METIRRIREAEGDENSDSNNSSRGKPQVVIGLSAYSDVETKKAALLAGMNDFISKPLSIPMLKECIQKQGIDVPWQ